jgi:hypothetical protein
VNPSLAALFQLEMLHGVGEVDMRAFDSRVSEGAVEKGPGRATKGRPDKSSQSAGCSPTNISRAEAGTFAENRLRGGAI